jgi:TorA maturation chaperone TorD
MSGMIVGQLSAPTSADQQVFEKHMAPWMGRFFADLETSKTADFYAHVGCVGRTFMEIETEAFALPQARGKEP